MRVQGRGCRVCLGGNGCIVTLSSHPSPRPSNHSYTQKSAQPSKNARIQPSFHPNIHPCKHPDHKSSSVAGRSSLDFSPVAGAVGDGQSGVGFLERNDLGPFQAQHGSAVSPVLVGDVLLVGNENEGEQSFLAGLDAKTGEDVWRLERVSTERRGSYATPVVFDGPDGKPVALFSSTGHGLTAVDPAKGNVVWSYDPGFDQRCVGSPVVANGVVFQSAGSGGGGKEYVALRLPTEENGEPEIAWTTRLKGLPYVPTPIAVGEHLFLFGDGGIATCLEASSGAVRWQERLDGGVPVQLHVLTLQTKQLQKAVGQLVFPNSL